jgi:hypothetical protein
MATTYSYSTTFFGKEYENAVNEAKVLRREAQYRKALAYFLKGVAIFGGIALATGQEIISSKIIGVVIAIAIGIEEWTSNHDRMIFTTSAYKAYFRLLYQVAHEYNKGITKVTELRDAGDDEGAKKELTILDGKNADLLYKTTTVLKEKIDKEDITFLNKLGSKKMNKNRDAKQDSDVLDALNNENDNEDGDKE